MEQIKEIWNLIFNWLGNGKKMIMGAAFLLIGIIGQSLSDKPLAQVPFVLMMIGAMCFVNALFSRIAKTNINLLVFLLINVFFAEFGIGFTAAGVVDGMTLYGIWAGCVLLVWILQIFVIRIKEIPKKVVLAFFETVLSAAAMGVAFLLPIFITVWRGNH